MRHDKGFSEGRGSALLIENNQWILLSLPDPAIFQAKFLLRYLRLNLLLLFLLFPL